MSISYDKVEVEINCGEVLCDECPQLTDNLGCALFMGRTNYIEGEPETPNRLSVCILNEIVAPPERKKKR